LIYLAFRYVRGFAFVRYEHIGTVTPVTSGNFQCVTYK